MTHPFNASSNICPGPQKRRGFLKMGLAGFATLSLPGVLRLRADTEVPRKKKTSVIMIWKPGGCSHIDTYDPKPNAPSEYRGPFATIPTAVPGLQFTELLPLQAKLAEKFTVLRSMRHGSPGHPAGSMRMFSGDTDTRDKPKPKLPSWMAVTKYQRSLEGNRNNPLPSYVSVNGPGGSYNGPAYLGDAYGAYAVTGDPNAPNFSVPNIGITDAAKVKHLGRRAALRQKLDTLERAFDQSGELESLDEFETQAMTLLTNQKTKEAFDLTREDEKTRDRYGRNTWGQQLLMARRLLEAGVHVVTTSLRGPLCGRVQNWDDHAVNHHVFDALRFRAGTYDQAVSALIEDIYSRGLDEQVLVVVTGEFGRTPKVKTNGGRDHWPRLSTLAFSGGGFRMGQV
ncbi:MAG: hypothetical protein CMJ78_22270, partial [Planctomycetaceae bacterium]|nr:hypothetical protein [Planctomycetaceae bacterium]